MSDNKTCTIHSSFLSFYLPIRSKSTTWITHSNHIKKYRVKHVIIIQKYLPSSLDDIDKDGMLYRFCKISAIFSSSSHVLISQVSDRSTPFHWWNPNHNLTFLLLVFVLFVRCSVLSNSLFTARKS